jgi:hypothetical protein
MVSEDDGWVDLGSIPTYKYYYTHVIILSRLTGKNVKIRYNLTDHENNMINNGDNVIITMMLPVYKYKEYDYPDYDNQDHWYNTGIKRKESITLCGPGSACLGHPRPQRVSIIEGSKYNRVQLTGLQGDPIELSLNENSKLYPLIFNSTSECKKIRILKDLFVKLIEKHPEIEFLTYKHPNIAEVKSVKDDTGTGNGVKQIIVVNKKPKKPEEPEDSCAVMGGGGIYRRKKRTKRRKSKRTKRRKSKRTKRRKPKRTKQH